MTSKPQEPLVEVGDKAMDTPPAALKLETMAPQPQVNLANVEDVAMNTPLAALNPKNMASQPQDDLQRVVNVSIDLPGKDNKRRRAHSGAVRSEPLIFLLGLVESLQFQSPGSFEGFFLQLLEFGF